MELFENWHFDLKSNKQLFTIQAQILMFKWLKYSGRLISKVVLCCDHGKSDDTHEWDIILNSYQSQNLNKHFFDGISDQFRNIISK